MEQYAWSIFYHSLVQGQQHRWDKGYGVSYNAMEEMQVGVKARIESDQEIMTYLTGTYDYAPSDACLPYLTYGTKIQTQWNQFHMNAFSCTLSLDIWSAVNSGDVQFNVLDCIYRLFNNVELKNMPSFTNVDMDVEWATTMIDDAAQIRHVIARLRGLFEPFVLQVG